MSGRKCDVLVEFVSYKDATGVEIESETSLTVWADEKHKEVIAAVEGVTNVYNTPTKTRFSVFTDARYDIDFIAKEIEAAILCADD